MSDCELDPVGRSIKEMGHEIERLQGQLRVAAGMLSTHDAYQEMHPEEVLEMIIAAANEIKGEVEE